MSATPSLLRRKRELREERKSNGFCATYGNSRDRQDRVNCQECREKANERYRKHQNKLKT